MKDQGQNIHVLLGMPRAGTTFLYHNLQLHPQIFVPFRRKTNYFAIHYEKPSQWYYEHFKDLKSNQVGLDTDTLSFLNNDSLERFKNNYNGQSKVILVVRDPAFWSMSLYKQIKSFTFNMPSFESYVKEGYTLIEDDSKIPYHFEPGDIKNRIEDVMNFFGDNILILNFDLIKKDPTKFLNAIENFLGIDCFFKSDNFKNERINAGNRKSYKLINSLLRKKWLIELLQNYVPRNFVLKLRNTYDKKSINNNSKSVTHYSQEDRQLAEEYYKSDIEYVKQLFVKSDIIVKDEKSFIK